MGWKTIRHYYGTWSSWNVNSLCGDEQSLHVTGNSAAFTEFQTVPQHCQGQWTRAVKTGRPSIDLKLNWHVSSVDQYVATIISCPTAVIVILRYTTSETDTCWLSAVLSRAIWWLSGSSRSRSFSRSTSSRRAPVCSCDVIISTDWLTQSFVSTHRCSPSDLPTSSASSCCWLEHSAWSDDVTTPPA